MSPAVYDTMKLFKKKSGTQAPDAAAPRSWHTGLRLSILDL